MGQSKLSVKWSEIFSKNLFESTHSTYIENEVKTIDYLVNFAIKGIEMKLGFALFVGSGPHTGGNDNDYNGDGDSNGDSDSNGNNTGYLIEEKTISYQDLFLSQLKQNANFLSKIYLGDLRAKCLFDSDKKEGSLEEISNESKKELLLETELEETLYRIYLALIFPQEKFRPAIIYVPTLLDDMEEGEAFLYIYTPLEKG